VTGNASTTMTPGHVVFDPLADLVAPAHHVDMEWGPVGVDPMCLELEAACAATICQPLSFTSSPSTMPDLPMVPHPWATADFGVAPAEDAVQVSVVASQVDDMRLAGEPAYEEEVQREPAEDFLQMLFKVPPMAILGISPLNPASPAQAAATPKRSLRQANTASSIPVAQRATLRLAKEMNVISGDGRRVEEAAAGLVERFKEPLSEVDIDGLAILTRVDHDAVHRAAQQAVAGRAAALAN
jgi:hypothetical protein